MEVLLILIIMILGVLWAYFLAYEKYILWGITAGIWIFFMSKL